MKHPVLESIKTRIEHFLRDRRERSLEFSAFCALFVACYPEPEVSYSNPQESGAVPVVD